MQQLVRATEIDPSLTPAQVDLAYVCCLQALCGFMAPRLAADKVSGAAEAIRPSSEHAGAILPAAGWVKFHFDRDMRAANDAFARSAHLPHDSRMARVRAMFALSRHRFDEAIGLTHSALRDDPFSPLLQARMAWAFHLAGESLKSVDQIRHAIASFPASEWTPLCGAIILCFNGEVQPAIKLAAEFVHQHPYFDWAAAVHAYTLACAGRGDEARAILERLEWLGRERFVLRSFTPAAYLALGDQAAALAELRKADEARCPWFFQMLADPRLKPLEGTAEFAQSIAALEQMELAAAAS
jgi:tetratricopeptide (TPR) repeat protein